MSKQKGQVTLGWILGIVLGAVLFASVIGIIADQTVLAAAGNVTGAAATVLLLVPLVLIFVFIAKIAGKI